MIFLLVSEQLLVDWTTNVLRCEGRTELFRYKSAEFSMQRTVL